MSARLGLQVKESMLEKLQARLQKEVEKDGYFIRLGDGKTCDTIEVPYSPCEIKPSFEQFAVYGCTGEAADKSRRRPGLRHQGSTLEV